MEVNEKNKKKQKNSCICPNCNVALSDDMIFCPYCGEQLPEKGENSEKVEASPQKEVPFLHETDKTALKALKAIPGFTPFLKWYMKNFNERQYRIINMSSNIKLGETQLQKYYDMLPPICEKLGIEIPDLYLKLDVNANAYTSGDVHPFIVITSGLLETIPDYLVPTVLAHECGHIACHHVLYSTMGRIILNGALGIGSRLVSNSLFSTASIPLSIAFSYWMRCSELSADRAAVYCDGSADNMTEVCLRLAGFDKDIVAEADKDLFMAQALEYKELVSSSKWDKTLEFLIIKDHSHPFTAVRAYECDAWAKTPEFEELLKTYKPN